MPSVVDISNSPKPKKAGNTPPPRSGPKPALLVGIGIGLVIAVVILWKTLFSASADGNQVAPYDPPHARTPQGATGGATGGGGSAPNVPRGLPTGG